MVVPAAQAWPFGIWIYGGAADAAPFVFYAQARVRKPAADAACGPRGEQEGKTASCPIRHLILFEMTLHLKIVYTVFSCPA